MGNDLFLAPMANGNSQTPGLLMTAPRERFIVREF
jgi:hypothetical protein